MQSLNQKKKSSKEDKGETSTPVNNKLTHRSLLPLKEGGEKKRKGKNRERTEEQERRINKRSIEQKHTQKKEKNTHIF